MSKRCGSITNIHFLRRYLIYNILLQVFSHNATWLSMTSDAIVFSHKALESSKADKECKEKGAEAICKAGLPACSSDRTKIIALLSKEKCREMVGW